jgi:hypothetical protein
MIEGERTKGKGVNFMGKEQRKRDSGKLLRAKGKGERAKGKWKRAFG